jgi:hypothetical protein
MVTKQKGQKAAAQSKSDALPAKKKRKEQAQEALYITRI